jgi:hypothetical protein
MSTAAAFETETQIKGLLNTYGLRKKPTPYLIPSNNNQQQSISFNNQRVAPIMDFYDGIVPFAHQGADAPGDRRHQMIIEKSKCNN